MNKDSALAVTILIVFFCALCAIISTLAFGGVWAMLAGGLAAGAYTIAFHELVREEEGEASTVYRGEEHFKVIPVFGETFVFNEETGEVGVGSSVDEAIDNIGDQDDWERMRSLRIKKWNEYKKIRNKTRILRERANALQEDFMALIGEVRGELEEEDLSHIDDPLYQRARELQKRSYDLCYHNLTN